MFGSKFNSFLTEFAEQDSSDVLEFPEDPSQLEDEELNSLHDQAIEAFDEMYGEGNVSADDLEKLQELSEGIMNLRAELDRRAEQASERSEQAAEIAAQIRPENEETEGEVEGENLEAETENLETEDSTEDENSVTASAEDNSEDSKNFRNKSIKVNLGGMRNRAPSPTGDATGFGGAKKMTDLVTAAPDMPGFSNGQGMTWSDVGRGVDRRLRGFNPASYAAANKQGRVMQQQYGVAQIKRPTPSDLVASDSENDSEVMSRAVDKKRLPKENSLTASGGWCAPSETLYDLVSLESTDGLISLPEVEVNRGGLRWPESPSFSSIYSDTGFHYTESEDEDGDYDGDGGGHKPCFHVDCPDFKEERLKVIGTCIEAGLLQQRGYPEMIERTVNGALTAHEHRLDSKVIKSLVDGSTEVKLPSGQVGAIAPILTAIELQSEHMKYKHRMERNADLEAVFPFWVHGVVRADLARRQGLDLFSVGDSDVDNWFESRGIAPQFVYNWQSIDDKDAEDFTEFPDSLKFLLYPEGTWVKGTNDVISIDTLYDSTLLGTNDYTALFMEEAWLTAKKGPESRVIEVPVCADGSTAAGVAMACDGTKSEDES